MLSSCIDQVKTEPPWIIFISFLGLLSLFRHALSVLKWVFIAFIRRPKDVRSYGSWALVTGSTDGIGKALAFQLARKGLNIVLVSRNSEKLERVTAEIQAEFPNTQIKIVVIDFSGDVEAGIREMEEEIEGLDLGVLINNVGVTYPGAMFFHEVEEKVWRNLVRVNLEGTTLVTRAVLKGMLERKNGVIVSIGSGASIVVPSHPLYAIYAATKAYIDQLSRCLHVEYKDHGVDVQCQVPLYVSTKMASNVAGIAKASAFTPSPDTYARSAVRRIGYEARCTPYWAHSLQWWFASLLPEPLLDAWRLSVGLQRRRWSHRPVD